MAISTKPGSEVPKTSGYEFFIPAGEYFNRVYAGSGMRRLLRDVEAIIPANEIYHLYNATKAHSPKISIDRLPTREFFDWLRSAKDNSGRDAYANAKFELGKVMVPPTYGIQTFVNVKALHYLAERDKFLRSLGINVVNSDKAYILRYDGQVRYGAILMPVIVIDYDKKWYDVPMQNLRDMVARGDSVTLRGVTGETRVDLEAILRDAEAEIAKAKPYVTAVKDGTHRAYTYGYRPQRPLPALRISNSPEGPTSAPISFDRMILTAERPDKAEHRYPGGVQTLRVDFRLHGADP